MTSIAFMENQMASNNVVEFITRDAMSIRKEPRHEILSGEKDLDEKYEEAIGLSQEWQDTVLDMMYDSGVLLETDGCLKDSFLLAEAIESIICRNYQIYHPFQEIADTKVQIYVDNDIVYANWKIEEE